jgi:hypothetical protein
VTLPLGETGAGSLADQDHQPLIDLVTAEWVAVVRSTTPCDRRAAEAALRHLYEVMGRPAPVIYWADGPEGIRAALGDVIRRDAVRMIRDAEEIVDDYLTRHGGWDMLVRGHSLDQAMIGLLTCHGDGGNHLWTDLWIAAAADDATAAGVPARQLRAAAASAIRGQTRWPPGDSDAAPGVAGAVVLGALVELPDLVVVEAAARLLAHSLGPVVEAVLAVWRQVPALLPLDDGVVWCVDRPRTVVRDPDGYLHAVGGPAVVYADGSARHYVLNWPVNPTFWTDPKEVLGAFNLEVRRIGIDHLGWDRFLDEMTLIAEADDPANPGQILALYDTQALWWPSGDGGPRILAVSNASPDKGGERRRFCLVVPRRHDDPVAAAADLFGLTKGEYSQLQRAT